MVTVCTDGGEEVARYRNPQDQALKEFAAWIDGGAFACLGARSALHRRTYDFRLYRTLGSQNSAEYLAADLESFAAGLEGTEEFVTFVAAFEGPAPRDERQFELALWRQLQRLHALDSMSWDPGVSPDPEDGRFSFSFAGHAFFVVGLHPRSSRTSRRYPHPVLAFNPRSQFERMREDGRFARLQRAIRARDLDIDGSINPMLRQFGEQSEARQYSGRSVDDNWRCPFHTEHR